jgi:hypothetical protein
VDTEYFSYPHNLFLEALMAMGVIGTLALLAILLRSALRATDLLRQGELFIPLVLLQYFIAAQFSGAIWGWSAMWCRWPASSPAVRSRVVNLYYGPPDPQLPAKRRRRGICPGARPWEPASRREAVTSYEVRQ